MLIVERSLFVVGDKVKCAEDEYRNFNDTYKLYDGCARCFKFVTNGTYHDPREVNLRAG
jgi:hypothetical protein